MQKGNNIEAVFMVEGEPSHIRLSPRTKDRQFAMVTLVARYLGKLDVIPRRSVITEGTTRLRFTLRGDIDAIEKAKQITIGDEAIDITIHRLADSIARVEFVYPLGLGDHRFSAKLADIPLTLRVSRGSSMMMYQRLLFFLLAALVTTTTSANGTSASAWTWGDAGTGCWLPDKDGGEACVGLFDPPAMHRKNICRGSVAGSTSTCSPNESLDHGPDEGKKTKILTQDGIDPFTNPGQREEWIGAKCIEYQDCKPVLTRTSANFLIWICKGSGGKRYANPTSEILNRLGPACPVQQPPPDPMPPPDDGGGDPPPDDDPMPPPDDDGGGGPPDDEYDEGYDPGYGG